MTAAPAIVNVFLFIWFVCSFAFDMTYLSCHDLRDLGCSLQICQTLVVRSRKGSIDSGNANEPPAIWHSGMQGSPRAVPPHRSEEHTSELQSLMRISYAVFCLKKKTTNNTHHRYTSKR